MKEVVVAVVYHSGSGYTKRQAEAVYKGIQIVEGVTPKIFFVDGPDAPWAQLEQAEALIFGAPTYMGGA